MAQTAATRPNDIPMKRCTRCGEEKLASVDHFPRDRSKRDGLYYMCKACAAAKSHAYTHPDPSGKAARQKVYVKENASRIASRRREWRNENAQRLRDVDRAYRARNAERIAVTKKAYYVANRERELARAKEWRAKNSTLILERRRAHYAENKHRYLDRRRVYAEAHKAENRERKRLWRIENRERFRIQVRRRIARQRGASGSHTVDDIERQYKAQGGKCFWCGVEVGGAYHVDHIIALARGGSNGPENIAIACAPCNTSKQDKLPTEWNGNLAGRLL